MEQEPDHVAISRFLSRQTNRRTLIGAGLGAGTGVAALALGWRWLETRPSAVPNPAFPSSEVFKLSADQLRQVDQFFQANYETLQQQYLVDAGNGAFRTIYDPDKRDTDAEVQAYSMLNAVHAGDQETFDRLWEYQKRYRNNVGTISWRMNADGSVAGADSAFDSTQDTAAALAIAHQKGWKGTYADDARSLLQSSMQAEIEPGTYIPRGGSYGGGSHETDPSYYDPYAYEALFAAYDQHWLQVAAACRNVMDNVARRIQSGQIKSYPDWVNAAGQPVGGVEDQPQIGYDSTRVALRQLQGALLLTGKSQANALKQVGVYNSFYESIVSQGNGYDIQRIVDGYTLDGKPTGHYSDTAFASAAVAASLASPHKAYCDYMLRQLPNLQASYPFNAYMLLNTLRILSGKA